MTIDNEIYSDVELLQKLRWLGVQSGDVLFVHSSLRSLGKFVSEGGAADGLDGLLAVFLKAVSSGGTVVVPAFNFGFCRGEAYDRKHTPSHGMGAFSEFLRQCPSSIRSRHPFQSIAAIGGLAEEIGQARGRTAFSSGSEFDVLLRHGCKILFFGVDFVETFIHVAEEQAGVSYRFWKTFSADYTDMGATRHVSVDFFARKLDLVPEPHLDNEKLGRVFREAGVIRSEKLGSGEISICLASDVVQEAYTHLVKDPYWALVSRPV